MDRGTEKELMRLLHGELSEAAARQWQDRIERESELRETYERLRKRWQDLELPEPAPAPLGFSARVVARSRADGRLAPAWWSQTVAGRLATAGVLAGGIAVGALLAAPGEAEDWSEYVTGEPTLAESYWEVLDESDDQLPQEDGS